MGLGSAVAISALVLAPFGHLADLLHGDQPFFGFDPENAVLTLVRVQRVPIPKCLPKAPCSCKAWSDALIAVPGDEMTAFPRTAAPAGSSAFQSWEPWSKEDLDGIRGCDHFPCDVKLDAAETAEMRKAGEKSRLATYLGLIAARVSRYMRTQERKEYEYPGNPVDPWKLFDERGLKPQLDRPAAPALFLRTLDFAPGKIQSMHQVVDRRAAESPKGESSAVWLRDVYTDHYFDSWGEYSQIDCDPVKGEIVSVLAVIGEMDLLKNKGFFAMALRPRYRSAFEDNGKIYLNKEFARIRAAAEKNFTEGK